MRNKKWTRERIIRHILECEAGGLPLTVGEPGISQALYQAGIRIFGSWRNAIQAAGIPPERGNCGEKWPPAKILVIIRNLARRKCPLSTTQLEHRHGSMLSAARRLFGSWTKAVMAAGVDPTRFQRIVPWTRERIIEAILIRALRNQSIAARSTQPKSLVEAGQKFFGSWAAAVEAAGLDPNAVAVGVLATPTIPDVSVAVIVREPGQSWTTDAVIAAIHARLRQQKPMNSSALYKQDTGLYHAARRRFGKWPNALLAAGLDPADHQKIYKAKSGLRTASTPPDESARKSQAETVVRPELPL